MCRVILAGTCLLTLLFPCSAQTVVASARVLCDAGPYGPYGVATAGPIVGAIINQTSTTITDLEVELSIITRDEKGALKRQRDIRFVVVPSLNQTGMVTKLEHNGDVYFNIPGKLGIGWEQQRYSDLTCDLGEMSRYGYSVLNVAAIAVTRIDGKSVLPTGKDGRPMKQAPLETMLQVPRFMPTPEQAPPTQRELVEAIREKNALLKSTIINNQLQDCLSRGTWACTFNNDTNINVVISQK